MTGHTLGQLVESARVTDAITVYRLCVNKGIGTYKILRYCTVHTYYFIALYVLATL